MNNPLFYKWKRLHPCRQTLLFYYITPYAESCWKFLIYIEKSAILGFTIHYFNISCTATKSEPCTQEVCSHQNRAACWTYPSTGHDTWRWFALSLQLLPLHLSCYTAQADPTPWLDNSPFLPSQFPLRLWRGARLSTTPLVHLPAWITEELASLSSLPWRD